MKLPYKYDVTFVTKVTEPPCFAHSPTVNQFNMQPLLLHFMFSQNNLYLAIVSYIKLVNLFLFVLFAVLYE